MFLSLYSCIVSNQPYGSQYTRFSWFHKFGPNVFWPVTGAEVDVDWRRRRRPRSSYRLCRVGGGEEGGKKGNNGNQQEEGISAMGRRWLWRSWSGVGPGVTMYIPHPLGYKAQN